MGPTRARLHRIHRLVLIASFAVLLSLPLADNALDLDTVEPRMEFRPLAGGADLVHALTVGPVAVRDALRAIASDRFGFRDLLVQTAAQALVHGLGVSSQPSVLVGRDGWMFLAGDGALVSYRALQPLPPPALRRVVRVFERRQAWLADRGIRYVLLVAPNKHSIYPEHLPRDLPAPRWPSRLDQLLAGLERRGVAFADAREALRAARRRERVYYPLDAHWNTSGAFVAYRLLASRVEEWFPAFRPLERGRFHREERPVNGDVASLPRMLGLPLDPSWRVSTLVSDEALRAQTPSGRPFGDSTHGGVGSVFTSLRPGTPGPRTFVVRDSFGNQMLTFLAESLPEVVYAWPPVPTRIRASDRERIEAERPELVIQLFSERTLEWGLGGLRPFGSPDAGR